MKDRRAANLATIHIRKTELGLSDDAYRDVLQDLVGVRTAKGLTPEQHRQVLDHFDKIAVASKVKLSKASRTGIARQAPPDKAALMSKINALLLHMGKTRDYLEHAAEGNGSMLYRLAKVDKIEFATPDGLRKVVAALSYAKERQA